MFRVTIADIEAGWKITFRDEDLSWALTDAVGAVQSVRSRVDDLLASVVRRLLVEPHSDSWPGHGEAVKSLRKAADELATGWLKRDVEIEKLMKKEAK